MELAIDMTAFLAAVFFAFVTVGTAAAVSERRDRTRLVAMVAIAWLVFAPITAAINGVFPFSEGGDDETYFELGAAPIASITDLFDLSRFADVVEQPGFPWLLSILNLFSGRDLLTFKLLNLWTFTILSLVGYRIGLTLENGAFGRLVASTILILTPLWYYVFFLLKDMTITLLLGLFLLGVVEQFRRNSLGAVLLVGASMLVLIPLRSALVLQCAAVWVGALMLRAASTRRGGGILAQTGGWLVVACILAIASNAEIMQRLGVFTSHRVVGSHEMLVTSDSRYQAAEIDRGTFLLNYLLIDTGGLSLGTWRRRLDPFWLRGLLALPWIFAFVPFFLVGVAWLFGPASAEGGRGGLVRRLRESRLVATPWGALALFVLSSMVVSWTVGDTTRWRIADVPVIGTIAAAGWRSGGPRARLLVLGSWIAASGVLFSIFYLLRFGTS